MSDDYTPNMAFVGQRFPAEVEYRSEHEAIITAVLPDGFTVTATDSNRQGRLIKPEVFIMTWSHENSKYLALLTYAHTTDEGV
jgi:hypothetical protein